MTNTLLNSHQDIINDAMRDLVDASVFLGELAPNPFLGANYGYTSGGSAPGPVAFNVIDKFPFTADTNATDVGDLTVTRSSVAGQSSKVSGYTSGGDPTGTIDKFPFASDGNATDVGDLTVGKWNLTGQSSTVSGYGYNSGGYISPYSVPFPSPSITNVIEKFPFASDANATDVGDLTFAREYVAGQSSDVSGYTSGGSDPSRAPTPHFNVIDKFPFASDANATDVGDLTLLMRWAAGQSSNVSGYTSGGQYGPNPNVTPPYVNSNVIQKFPFASDGNATDVGDLTIARTHLGGGQSSTASGYTSGGAIGAPSLSITNFIDKFPFASDGNATDVGDLTVGRGFSAGQQY
jgi:hypothetical protein